jgi:hypothetical protein
VATTSGSAVVTGTGTAFTSAWIGRRIWIDTLGGAVAQRIISVARATSLTCAGNFGSTVSGKNYAIYDQQSTHLRLYDTADGGAVYFRTQRNAFVEAGTTLSAAGLQFTDNDNSEPPKRKLHFRAGRVFQHPSTDRQIYCGVPIKIRSLGCFWRSSDSVLFEYRAHLSGQSSRELRSA